MEQKSEYEMKARTMTIIVVATVVGCILFAMLIEFLNK
jgi:preprotein translocase subunit SecE